MLNLHVVSPAVSYNMSQPTDKHNDWECIISSSLAAVFVPCHVVHVEATVSIAWFQKHVSKTKSTFVFFFPTVSLAVCVAYFIPLGLE